MPAPKNSRPKITAFASGLDHPEGLAFDRHGNLWAGGEGGQIYRIPPDGKTVETVANTGGFNLGLAFSPEGWLLICDCGSRKLWRYDPASKELAVFAETSGAAPLGHMNFAAFDAAGAAYVSESGTWGKRDGLVHRFTPDGRGTPWARKLAFANGLALAPDGTSLLVVQSTAENVLRIPILPGGKPGKAEIFVAGVGHVPDGLAFDATGHLYVSCFGDNRIWRVSPKGRKTLFADDPTSIHLNRATNLAFGGPGHRKLFVANLGGWHIAKLTPPAAGHPLPC